MSAEKKLKFAVFGTGFWSAFQIAGWRELPGVECAALYNRSRDKAEALARSLGIGADHVYSDPGELLTKERVDFVDIVTNPETHAPLTELAASFGRPVISQKPMSTDLASAERMLASCAKAGVPLFVHENWRWQAPVRRVAALLREGAAGKPFRARISYLTAFRVYENQPFLRTADRFILADIGPHLLDTARFLFGEMSSVYCTAKNVNPEVKGEDVASLAMKAADGTVVNCDMSYFSRIEHDRFPETYMVVECERGTIELKPDFRVSVTTAAGTVTERVQPAFYAWADPQYALVHASIVECNRNLLAALRGGGRAETTGEDNLRSMRLVEAAYESAESGRVVAP
jgi:predicted dehydrogenase